VIEHCQAFCWEIYGVPGYGKDVWPQWKTLLEFQPCQQDALYKGALKERKDDYHRKQHQQRAGHHQVSSQPAEAGKQCQAKKKLIFTTSFVGSIKKALSGILL